MRQFSSHSRYQPDIWYTTILLLHRAMHHPCPQTTIQVWGGMARRRVVSRCGLRYRHLILDLIDEATDRDPERTAVICGEEHVSYRQLQERSRWVAYDLIARGVGRERMICVAVEPSPWAPIAMLGVLRAGAAYVPLDPS